MRGPVPRIGAPLWLGLGAAGLFLYPLAAGLNDNPFYLQWQPAHSAEAGVAFLVLAVLGAAAVSLCWPHHGRVSTLLLFLIALPPLMSFGAGISRQLPFGNSLRTV